MPISDRQKLILKALIREYIKTAQPVSSGWLVQKSGVKVSPATIRNEMMELESAGYIYQPHTSAGRVPTALAYSLYLQEFIDDKKIQKAIIEPAKVLDEIFAKDEMAFRQMAKAMAEMSEGAIFWAFHKNDLYHTGLSNLFAQPEFRQFDLIRDVSGIIDRLEDIVDNIFDSLPMGETVLIGDQNPCGDFLSVLFLKYKIGNQSGLCGILGPLRMDYEKNLGIIKYLKEKLI